VPVYRPVDHADLATSVGDLAAAREHLGQALAHATDLAKAHPDNHWRHNRPAVIRSRLGDVAVAAGDLAAAEQHYRAGLAIAERLAAADPANTGWATRPDRQPRKAGVAVAARDPAQARRCLVAPDVAAKGKCTWEQT
jgi:hypothetical protein